MPQNGKKKQRKAYRHDSAMSEPNDVTFCVRMPKRLHMKLMEMQAQHMVKTGSAVSRNSLILNILSRHAESGKGIEV